MILQQIISQETGFYISKFVMNLIAPLYAITVLISTFLVPCYLIKFLIQTIKNYKDKKQEISIKNENENLMLCKKCGVNLSENILCKDCSDEVLTLFLIDKMPAEEIEQSFNLLPTTVEYWHNTCKLQNGGDFSYLETTKYNYNYVFSSEQHIMKRMIAFLFDIFVFEIVVIVLFFTFG